MWFPGYFCLGKQKKNATDWQTDPLVFVSRQIHAQIESASLFKVCLVFVFFLRIATCILEKVIFNANRSRPIWFLTIYNYNKIKNLFIIAIRKIKKTGLTNFVIARISKVGIPLCLKYWRFISLEMERKTKDKNELKTRVSGEQRSV